MFIGHYGPALLLHRSRPSVPLWVYFLAAQAVDILWAAFILSGVEHARIVPGFTESNGLDLYDMPYTHSLLSTFVWAAVAGVGWAMLRRAPSRWAEGAMVGGAVASHFVADLLVHVPDLPIWPSAGAKLGFGLWRHRELALLVELAFFTLPALAWLRAPWHRGGARKRRVMLGGMALLLVASFYTPTPPATWAMALTGLFTNFAAAWAAVWASGSSESAGSGGSVRKLSSTCLDKEVSSC